MFLKIEIQVGIHERSSRAIHVGTFGGIPEETKLFIKENPEGWSKESLEARIEGISELR